MAVSANFGELLEPGLRAIYGLTAKQFATKYDKMFEVDKSTKAYEEKLEISGLGLAPEKPKAGAVAIGDFEQSYLSRILNVSYGLGFIVEKELIDDDQYGVVRSFPKALARSINITREIIAALVYDRAFDSGYAGGDGVELCGTHTLKNGQTFSNEPSIPMALTEEGLRQALEDLADFVDPSGLPMDAMPKRLIVAPHYDFTASKVLESTLEPESANNAINAAKGRMPYMVNPYLSNSKYWYIMTDVPEGMVWYDRVAPALTRDNDFWTDNALFKSTFRASCGHHDPRGLYGVPHS